MYIYIIFTEQFNTYLHTNTHNTYIHNSIPPYTNTHTHL